MVSQRGTMFSEPALTCASIDDFARELLGLRFYSGATERDIRRRRKPATGNSPPPAPTLAPTIRPKVPLISPTFARCSVLSRGMHGTSYGSYLAQTLMRDHPEGIRSFVLDSVLPTNYTVAANWQNARDGFDNLFQACAAETGCDAAHPRLEETFTGLVNKLEAEPPTTTVSDPATGKVVKVVLDGGALIDWLRTRTTACPRSAPRRIGSMGSPPAGPRPLRRSPWIGQVGRLHPVRVSLPSATGWPLASAVAKTTRSRRRGSRRGRQESVS